MAAVVETKATSGAHDLTAIRAFSIKPMRADDVVEPAGDLSDGLLLLIGGRCDLTHATLHRCEPVHDPRHGSPSRTPKFDAALRLFETFADHSHGLADAIAHFSDADPNLVR